MDLRSLISVTVSDKGKKLSCKKCRYKDRPYVPPSVTNSDVIIIGEAPGKTEAESKIPFTGRSGQALRKIIQEAGLDDKKITILNTVCCHPPENETPDKKVVQCCSELFLTPNLSQLSPKVIVLVGSIALNHFFPDATIMEKRGNFLKKNGTVFLPTLHPAYCLRNPDAFSLLKKDFVSLKKYLSGETPFADRKYVTILDEQTLNQAVTDLKDKQKLCVDIETNQTLNPFKSESKIWTIAFCGSPGTAYCFPLEHPEQKNEFLKNQIYYSVRSLLKSPIEKCFHNAAFDVKFLRHFGFEVNNVLWDTMVMAYLLDEHRSSLTLKALASQYLDGCQEAFSEDLKALSHYNCEDVDNGLRLQEVFYKELNGYPKMLDLYKSIMAPMIDVIVDMELNGILLDLPYIEKIKNIYEEKRESVVDLILEKYPESRGTDINSPKQLSDLFFKRMKLTPIKETKTGYSVDDEVLNSLAEKGVGIAKYILKYRSYEKALNTYIVKMPKIIEQDGRIHGNFNITGTKTLRLSSSKPNLQNIPRDKLVKKMFVAPSGRVFINFDASQAELRVSASLADEATMIRAYNEGKDIHRITASSVLKVMEDSISKEDRQKAKGVNFGFIYGASAEGFQGYAENTYGVKFSLEECRRIRSNFFSTYSGLQPWYDRVEDFIRKYGYIEYPVGARARFPQSKGLAEIPGEIRRRGINYPVQGSSYLIVAFVMARLRSSIRRYAWDAKFLITVHDSILLEAIRGIEDDVREEMALICQKDIPKKFPWLKVPMVFDMAVGRNWGDVTEIPKCFGKEWNKDKKHCGLHGNCKCNDWSKF